MAVHPPAAVFHAPRSSATALCCCFQGQGAGTHPPLLVPFFGGGGCSGNVYRAGVGRWEGYGDGNCCV